MVGLVGTSYTGKQYYIIKFINGYLPDGDSERRAICLIFKNLGRVGPRYDLKTTNPRRVEVPLLKVLGSIVTQVHK